MMEWFKLGGWGMYPILIVGLIATGNSAFYAARGDARVHGSIKALSKALVWFIATAVSSDLIAVFFFLKGQNTADPQHTKILYEGLGESLTPLTLGGAFLGLVWTLAAVGQRKADQRV